MIAGARVAPEAGKRAPADFALWKRAEPGHIMQWPSPWGMGFPGWHLECSAMSMKYLGESFDIHGGGIENQFPHHDDEIAQAEAATGKPFVKYWLHNNMVTVGGQKMGKSLGNFITLKDAFQKWDPMVLRLFILQSHYRSPLDFSDEALGAAAEGFERIRSAVSILRKNLLQARLMRGLEEAHGLDTEEARRQGTSDSELKNTIEKYRSRFADAMDDDFNTPMALGVLFDLARETRRIVLENPDDPESIGQIELLYQGLGEGVLGLAFEQQASIADRDELSRGFIRIIIGLRNEARAAKNFAQADAIRKRLDEIGIILEDAPDGTKWRFK
jgi:cysteinyl-tRNA synthetase